MTDSDYLSKIRAICLAFPDAHETLTWGQPHFRVNNKIFAGFGEEKGKPDVVGFKLTMPHAADLVQIPGFWPAPYVGHKGWVSMDLQQVEDWKLVAELIRESYQLIAPKRSLAKLSNPRSDAEAVVKKNKAAKKTTTKKKAAKKKAAKKKAAKKKVAKKKAAKKKSAKTKSAKNKVSKKAAPKKSKKSSKKTRTKSRP